MSNAWKSSRTSWDLNPAEIILHRVVLVDYAVSRYHEGLGWGYIVWVKVVHALQLLIIHVIGTKNTLIDYHHRIYSP